MTTADADPVAIFADARGMHEAALTQWAAGDVRDAAEKAWCATLRATEALLLARTGEAPQTSTAAGRRLRAAAEGDPSLHALRNGYLERQVVLHGECFYHEYCEPIVAERLIRETADYIHEAERLSVPA